MTWEIIPLTFELPSVQQIRLRLWWRCLRLGLELDRDPVYLYTHLQSKHIYTRRVQQYILFSPYVRSHFVPSATWLLSTLQPFLKHCIMENVKGRNNNCHHSCFECCCGTLSRTFILSLKNSSHFLPLFSIPSLKQTKSLRSMIMILLYMYTSCFAATFIILLWLLHDVSPIIDPVLDHNFEGRKDYA